MENKSSFRNIQVLIIDDDPAIRDILSKNIQNMGYCVHQAENAESAIELLTKQYYNVVVTDIKMGKMDGIELSQKLRDIYPAISIIIVTGFPSAESRRAAQRLSAIQYIEKPVQMDLLASALSAAARWNISQIIARAAEKYLKLKKDSPGAMGEKIQRVKAEIKNAVVSGLDIMLLNEFEGSGNPEATEFFRLLNAR